MIRNTGEKEWIRKMELVLWVIISLLFVLSIAGIFLPVLPDTVLLWAGFLLYHFFVADPGMGLPAAFWWGMAILSVLLYAADVLTNLFFVKKYGGSRLSALAAVIGVLLGVFLFPPLGMIVLPFVFVVGVELFVQKRSLEEAARVGVGSLVAFLGSAVVKVLVQLGMILWFFMEVF